MSNFKHVFGGVAWDGSLSLNSFKFRILEKLEFNHIGFAGVRREDGTGHRRLGSSRGPSLERIFLWERVGVDRVPVGVTVFVGEAGAHGKNPFCWDASVRHEA